MQKDNKTTREYGKTTYLSKSTKSDWIELKEQVWQKCSGHHETVP